MTVAENLRQKGVISDWNFFLKSKSFLFTLLCIVHINFAYQNFIPLPSIKYDWFYVSKIQIYIIYMLCKMMYIVIFINPKTRSTDLHNLVNL